MKIMITALFGWMALVMNHIPAPMSAKSPSPKWQVKAEVPLTKTHWKLIGLSGKQVPSPKEVSEMYIVFKDDSTVGGNGGCNKFSGTYMVGKKNEISFGNMVRTNRYCPGINWEERFLNALAKADHYLIIKDTLALQRQFSAVAKFEVVR